TTPSGDPPASECTPRCSHGPRSRCHTSPRERALSREKGARPRSSSTCGVLFPISKRVLYPHGMEEERMRALVTGGGGFLGLAIVKMLLARGHTVRTYSRGAYPALAA